jgi:hypothetical protein
MSSLDSVSGGSRLVGHLDAARALAIIAIAI